MVDTCFKKVCGPLLLCMCNLKNTLQYRREKKKRGLMPVNDHHRSLLRWAAQSPLQYGNKLYQKEEGISHPLSKYHKTAPPV